MSGIIVLRYIEEKIKGERQMKIEREKLLEEIGVMLKDELIAEITEKADGIELRFLNGQTFKVVVEEL